MEGFAIDDKIPDTPHLPGLPWQETFLFPTMSVITSLLKDSVMTQL